MSSCHSSLEPRPSLDGSYPWQVKERLMPGMWKANLPAYWGLPSSMISVPVLNEPEDYIFPPKLFDELVKKTVSPIIIPRYPSFFSEFHFILFPKLRKHHENRRILYLESNHHGFYWAMNTFLVAHPT